MTSVIKRCLAAGIGAAWLFVPPAYAEDATSAAKGLPAMPAGPSAAPRRVSPYAKYARAYAEAHRDTTPARVSLKSIQQAHRAAGRPAH